MKDPHSIPLIAQLHKNNYYDCNCFWCGVSMNQRGDTRKRQLDKYGHSCCKHCFGKEESFKDARTRVMNTNNPFLGKKHSEETIIKLSQSRIGKKPWNIGLTALTNEKVAQCAVKTKAAKAKIDVSGANNPNWRGGISFTKKNTFKTRNLHKWMKFRREIINRDGRHCIKCGETNPRLLRVHHLISRTQHPELEYDPWNCSVFCEKCHRLFHKTYGLKKFGPQNFKAFINLDRSPSGYFKFD